MMFVIKNYGCQMNINTAEKIENRLIAYGFTKADGPNIADIIIFNTCCVRDTAEQKIISHIGEVGRLKSIRPDLIIAVIGCLSQKEGEKLKKRMPYVDIILGTADAMDIVEILRDMMYKDTAKIPCIQSVISHKALRDTAYIDITYGCENYCTYCIVPFVRGKFRCRPLAEIVGEFNSVKDNAKNICLLGQNVNAYYDEKTGINFPKLLSILCGIDGDFNLKFLSSHPKDFDKELIEVIAKNEKISRDIHLPIQSGCDKILRRMNRQYTAAEYAAKVKMLRAAVPGIHITTDIICGFPGETEEDFTETVETVKILKFDAAYIFPYSRRSKTVADKMENQVPLKTRKARTTKLISIFRCMKK